MEFNNAINPFSKCPIFQINKHIGYDAEDGLGIDGVCFSREVFEIDCSGKAEKILFYINSLGGDVIQGYDIFNSIISCQTDTEAIIQGFAYSVAGWLPMAANKVRMYDYSSWMCHLPYNPNDRSEKSAFLDGVANSVAIIISQNSGKNGKPKKSVEDVLLLLRNTTFYSAQQMYDEGLIDEIIPSIANIKKIELTEGEEVKNQYKQQQLVFNKFFENKEKPKIMLKVINKLGLVDGSGEDSIVAEIARRENDFNAINREKESLDAKLKAANDSQEELQRKLKEAQNKVTEVENELKASNDEVAAMKDDKAKMEVENKTLIDAKNQADADAKAQETENKKLAATNLVTPFKDCGKIKEEAFNGWIEMAVENFDRTKLMLDAITTNASLPKPENTGILAVEKSATQKTLDHYMASNKSKLENREKERLDWEKLQVVAK